MTHAPEASAEAAQQARSFRSVEFRRTREPVWAELEALVDRVQRNGPSSLSADELTRLAATYRATVSSLGVARAISLDQNVVAHLESLVIRALPCIYGPKRSFRDVVTHFVTSRWPAAVRALARPLLLAGLILVAGVATGWITTARDSDRFFAFVDPEMAAGRDPDAPTSTLREHLYDGDAQAGDALSAFSAYLFRHNAQIGILCFALGFLAGLPVFYLLFSNGAALGAFAALHHDRGLSTDFWGWILPHGVTELLALVLCGAAGLAIGEALLFPGSQTRTAKLADRGRIAGTVVVGAVIMLLIAGLIEGVFRQRVQDVAIRYGLALVTATVWSAYFYRVGRKSKPWR